MWHGERIGVMVTAAAPAPGVDTPADLERVRALWAQGSNADDAAIQGAFKHGHTADQWPADRPFSASALAMHLKQ